MKNVKTSPERSVRQIQQVTLKEVANAAGVSIMTVSNVINNRSNVSAARRQQVQDAIAQLGYVPNRAAQMLAGVSRPNVGLLYPGINTPFLAAVIVGAMESAARLNMDVTVQLVELDNPRALRATMNRMQKNGVDGFLLPSPIAELASRTLNKKQMGFPVVAISPGLPVSGFSTVRCDERQAAYDLVTKLVELGHTRIGHIAGPETQSGSIARMQGYTEAMEAHGLEVDPERIIRSASFRFQDGLTAAKTLISREQGITAIFAANDTIAASVLALAHQQGISVPDELSVVGYDDAPLAEQVWPALTTVHQDAHLMTERAMEIMERSIKAQRSDRPIHLLEDIVFPYQIVERNSCASVPSK